MDSPHLLSQHFPQYAMPFFMPRVHTKPPSTRPPFPKRYLLYYSLRNFLNKLTTIIPRALSADDAKRYWIIYIHGGAWRDPDIKYDSFFPAYWVIRSRDVAQHIAGYVSVSYSLSPHPNHPERPDLPGRFYRRAKHPDHIHDVVKALKFLQKKYGFTNNYILVGHSCGATLAFQSVMRGAIQGTDPTLWEGIKPPKAIIGLEGIYDIPALLSAHQDIPAYREITEGAFGQDEEVWRSASPTAGNYQNTWSDGVLAMLVHSEEDELVEKNQVDLMNHVLQPWVVQEGKRRVILIERDVRGNHDDLWKEGTPVADCIEKALNTLLEMSRQEQNDSRD